MGVKLPTCFNWWRTLNLSSSALAHFVLHKISWCDPGIAVSVLNREHSLPEDGNIIDMSA